MTALGGMYGVGLGIGLVSFFVSRGPDGRFFGFLAGYALLATIYVGLAWVTRHQPIWPHLGVQAILFLGAAAMGMAPKPHLTEMAGMLYFLLPGAVLAMLLMAVLVRWAGKWF